MEDITILGSGSIPVEVKKAIALFPKVDQAQLRGVLKRVIDYIESTNNNNNDATQDETPISLNGVTQEQSHQIFTSLYLILRGALRSKIKTDLLSKELTDLKLPETLVQDILKLHSSQRKQAIENTVYDNRIRYPGVESMKWRCDVTISTSSFIRVMKPTVFITLTLTNGQTKSFELSHDQFSQLRYNTAKVLKEVNDIEKLPILKM